MASYLINQVPGIANLSYLELGVHMGSTFNAVLAKHKVSVDLTCPATYTCSTRDFFQQNRETFDVIYIDADHMYESVLEDFNSSLKILNSGGYIFMHDLFPQEEWLIKSYHCGTAYQFLYSLYATGRYNYFVQNSDYGLTVVKDPKIPVAFSSTAATLSYERFRQEISSLRLYSRDEMMQMISRGL